MMKRFYYGAMATGLLFAACSSDNLSEPGKDNGPADADKTVYVKMSIHGDVADATRAASDDGAPDDVTNDFANGEGSESAVNTAYFVFYDEGGEVVGDIVQVNLNKLVTSPGNETIEKTYENVVPVSIRKGQNDPAQVICYINPTSPAALMNPLSTIETITRQAVTNPGVDADNKPIDYFPMSNSVFYANTTSLKPQIAVQIGDGQLFKSEELADAAKPEEKINVYVERYASKLKFTSTNASAYVTATAPMNGDETEVTLQFVPERWALNAVANETYVVKSFRQASATGQILGTDYSYSLLNTEINNGLDATSGAWEWNNPSYHRSYWAVSPAYFTEKYPEVASDVVNSELHQKYYKYSELSGTNPAGHDPNDTKAKYFRETTVGDAAIRSANPAAAMPSVILVGHYTVKVGSGEAQQSDFYTYLKGKNGNPLVYFKNKPNLAESAVTGGESMLKRFLDQTTVLYKKVGDQYVRLNASIPEDLNLLIGAVSVDVPDPNALKLSDSSESASIKVPARQRTLVLNSGNTTGIYVANGNGYKEIVDANPTENQITLAAANKVLMQNVGFANFYTNGLAYFNIPVKHYGWYRTGNPNRTEGVDNATIDWNNVMVGDFGMVRNHAYDINVTEIKGLATGIGGVNDPIVPPADTNDYYVAYRVHILKWAVVPQQNVKL